MPEKSSKLYGIPVLKNFVNSSKVKAFITKTGNLNFDNYDEIAMFVQENEVLNFSAGELFSLNLLNKLYLDLIDYYRKNVFPNCFDQLKTNIKNSVSKKDFDFVMSKLFEQYNINENRVTSNIQLFSELILIWLNNQNTGFSKYKKIYDYTKANEEQHFEKLLDEMDIFFSESNELKNGLNLIKFLQLPSRLFPDSIQKQLEFIKDNWSEYLGNIEEKILRSRDYLNEEQKRFIIGDKAEIEIPVFSEEEPERFTKDEHWMPNLVLIAKNFHVWLEQLSRKYGRWIRYFDDVPDEEIELLANRGITGIWFIGIWERSPISRKIKHLTGNVTAESSAYSIRNYYPETNLGGWESLLKLKTRLRKYGIRLGVDMIPNHTGLDSDWIVEHPDWFLSVAEPPFPGYSFNGPNLSNRSEIEVYLEDHYYDNSDAAVVFKLYHKIRDKVYYIYHGNDGTGLPWNDTAQLDYLNPQVRKTVKNTILEIANNFSIIRFDAAMTLAKRHIRRLWYPQPGEGGDIPSRANYGMNRSEFDKRIPHEFWREVVDKVEKDAPDTLLLAEAFWMMEGYFVRTLGMHRVYNSAFMNMLKDEKNKKFKQLIFDVLEFNPGILKRFVNFMSNPDEETAIDQFGSDDKYFGTCVLMSTLPGLPMFAHGQIEGFSEKYGMDFLKPRLKESENEYLIKRHNKEIFPLLRNRNIFSDVSAFYIFNFLNISGAVNDNVITYANCTTPKKVMIIFNNRFADTQGFIHTGINYKDRKNKKSFKADKCSISKILDLEGDNADWVLFNDITGDKEYLRPRKEIRKEGIRLNLKAFQYHVFMDFRTIKEDEKGTWRKLFKKFGYEGVKSWEKEYHKYQLGPVLKPCKAIINKEVLQTLYKVRKGEEKFKEFLGEFSFRLQNLENAIEIYADLEKSLNISNLLEKYYKKLFDIPKFSFETENKDHFLFIWIFVYGINNLSQTGKHKPGNLYKKFGIDFITEEYLDDQFYVFSDKLKKMITLLTDVNEMFNNDYAKFNDFFADLVRLKEVAPLIDLHEWENEYWFDKDLMEYLFQISWYYYLIEYNKQIDEDILNNIKISYTKITDSKYKFKLYLNLLKDNNYGQKKQK